MHYLLFLFLMFLQGLLGCGLVEEPVTSSTCSSNCRNTSTSSSVSSSVKGKLAQSYVKEATIWADQLVDGKGNLDWDTGEPLAISGDAGDYQITGDAPWILSGDFQIVTSGGKKSDSNGNWIDASPMVAPAPEPGQTETNVTPLTTLVAFEPALKEKLEELGGWNADIASPNGVSGNLLRIAKTVESLSSTLSGGSSPVVADFSASLKSVGKLATQLNSASGNLADNKTLNDSASQAIDAVLTDPILVPNSLTAEQQEALRRSVEQAVQGITAVIPPTNEVVVEDPALLAQIEEILDNASIDETVSVAIQLGGANLQFPPVIEKITMELEGTTLSLSAVVSDDNLSGLSYDWFSGSVELEITNLTESAAQVLDFDNSDLRVSLLVMDSANNVDIASCTWQTNPTTCNCLDGECN